MKNKISQEENEKKLYEIYHASSTPQTNIINPNNFTYKHILKIIEKNLPSKKNRGILDIGCGSGTLSLYLANKGYTIKGIDISDRAISVCKKSVKALGLKNISFEVINFPKNIPRGKYDLIIFSEVIEHLEDDDLALTRIYKLLNPKGTLFISTPSINAPLHKLGLTKKFDNDVGHLRRYAAEELIKKLRNHKFTIDKVYKTEGVLRNFLFINPLAGKLIRFIKYFLVDIFTLVDNILAKIFGESQIIIIAKKA